MMGEGGTSGSTGPVAEPGEPEAWALWRRMRTWFPAWSLLPSTFYTPGSLGYLGVDVLSGLRRNASTGRVFALLSPVTPQVFETVSALAALNARRHEEMFRALALLYVTIPLTLFLAAGELAPDEVRRMVSETSPWRWLFVGAMTAVVAYYYMSLWRARQIVNVVDLVRVERNLPPPPAPERRGEVS